MKYLIFPLLVFLNSCAALIGGVAGGAAAMNGPDPDTVQTVMLRSQYRVNCSTIKGQLNDLIKNNDDISNEAIQTPNICSEIKSSESVFKGCLKPKHDDEYRIADGSNWTRFDYYLIHVSRNKNDCSMYLYTRLDFDLMGNPFTTASDCQKGMDADCRSELESAKATRERIIKEIEDRSKIVFGSEIEEKIFNYYVTDKARMAFEE